jgi:RNA polymerase sigma-70 factor (ECF subfamily)
MVMTADLMALSEEEVTRAFLKSGSEESFSALARFLIPKLLRYFEIRGCNCERAEELTQDVLLASYRHAVGLRNPEAFGAWVYRIARNALLQEIRKRGREVATVALDELRREPGALKTRPGSETPFVEWIACLKSEEKELMLLRFVDGMNYDEIAAVLEIPAGTAKWKVFSCKAKILRHLRKGIE